MGTIKDRNGKDLTEAEEIKKKDYTDEQYKEGLNAPDNHDGAVTHLEPDTLEYKVKWALERITVNKILHYTLLQSRDNNHEYYLLCCRRRQHMSPRAGFPGGSVVKNTPAMQETWVWPLSREDPLEKELATHSSILAREIPWTEEPGRL